MRILLWSMAGLFFGLGLAISRYSYLPIDNWYSIIFSLLVFAIMGAFTAMGSMEQRED